MRKTFSRDQISLPLDIGCPRDILEIFRRKQRGQHGPQGLSSDDRKEREKDERKCD